MKAQRAHVHAGAAVGPLRTGPKELLGRLCQLSVSVATMRAHAAFDASMLQHTGLRFRVLRVRGKPLRRCKDEQCGLLRGMGEASNRSRGGGISADRKRGKASGREIFHDCNTPIQRTARKGRVSIT